MQEITLSEYIKSFKDPEWNLILSEHLTEKICHDNSLVYEHRYYDDGTLRFDIYLSGEILYTLYDRDAVRLMDTALFMLGKDFRPHDSKEP